MASSISHITNTSSSSSIPPVVLTTTNGEVALNLEGDVTLLDGTVLRNWLLNKYSETNLCSEGLSNSDVNSGIEFLTLRPDGPKQINMHPILKQWIFKRLTGYIYGCITAGAAWQRAYREWMVSLGSIESLNATSVYTHRRGVTVSCFVDDPIIFLIDKAAEDWYHNELDKRFDVKHHSFLTRNNPLQYCGTRLPRDDGGESSNHLFDV